MQEHFVVYVGPLAVSALLVAFYLYPKFKYLKLKIWKGDLQSFYFLCVLLAIAALPVLHRSILRR